MRSLGPLCRSLGVLGGMVDVAAQTKEFVDMCKAAKSSGFENAGAAATSVALVSMPRLCSEPSTFYLFSEHQKAGIMLFQEFCLRKQFMVCAR